jgi:ferritin-like metal-binding protein YciE
VSETPQPPRIENVRELLLKQLGKLLVVEERLARSVLPKLKQEAQDEQLKQAFDEHLQQTRQHVQQVQAAFAELGAEPAGQEAEGLEGLKQERESLVAELAPAFRDGFNASAAMGTEHYEIAAYEAAIRLADALGATEVGTLLRATLEQEVQALEKLGTHATRLAEQAVKEPAVL